MTRARDLADIIGPNGDLVVTGDLQVTGTTTTVNSTTVEIADNNILLGSGATTNAQNTGAGLSVLLPDASPDEFATLLYTTSSDSWSFNKNVGIGTTAPGESLHLRAAAPAIRFEDTDVSGVNQIYSNGAEFVISADQSDLDASSKITFLVDGSSKASIYDSGTLAIGAGASSNYLLSTNYDANATFSNAVSDFTQMWQNSGTNMLGVAGADDLSVRLVTNNGYALAFNNAGTEAFRITTGGNIEAPSGTSGNFEIGIEDNATDTFRNSAKGLIIKGNDAYTGGSPQQASAGGDVEVRAGFGVDNTGLGAFAGDLTLSGGIPSSGNNSGAGQIFLKTNNTEVLTVSRDQKVGIGTTSPNGTLVVSTNGAQGIEFFPTAAAGVASTQYYNRSGTAYIRNRNIALDHTFNLSGATDDAVIIAASGNVGIGTGSPAQKLDINGTLRFTPNTADTNYSADIAARYDSEHPFELKVLNNGTSAEYFGVYADSGGANNRVVFPTGNVGVGTTSPDYALDVYDVGEAWIRADSSTSTEATANSGLRFAHAGVNHGVLYHRGSDDAFLYFDNITNETRFIINSSGNLGIGTNNPGAKLDIQTSHSSTDVTAANSNSTLRIGNSATGNGIYNAIKFAANQQDMYIMSFNNNQQADRRLGFFLGSVAGDATTDERLSIRGNGNVGIGTTNPTQKLEVNGTIKAGIAGNSSANAAALKVYASGATDSTKAAIAIQQGSNEGDTIIFADYEPYVEWGISTENNTNQIHFTSGDSTNSLGSKTVYNNSGNARTAFIKFNHDLSTGKTLIGGNVGIGTESPAAKLHVDGDLIANGPVRYFNYLSSARGFLEAEGSYSLLGNDSSGNADIEITIVFKNTSSVYDTAMVTLDLTHAGNTDPMEAASYFIKLRQRNSAVAVLGGPTKVFGDDRPISTSVNGLTLTVTVSSEGASTATQAAKVKVLGGYYGVDSLSITTA